MASHPYAVCQESEFYACYWQTSSLLLKAENKYNTIMYQDKNKVLLNVYVTIHKNLRSLPTENERIDENARCKQHLGHRIR